MAGRHEFPPTPEGYVARCKYCGQTKRDLDVRRVDGKLPPCPDAPAENLVPATGASSLKTDENINVNALITIATYTSARSLLEDFGKNFVKRHKRADCKAKCKENLSINDMTAVLRHYELCPAIRSSPDFRFEDTVSATLTENDINLPSKGALADVYSALSTAFHSSNVFKTSSGKVLIPSGLPDIEKRLLIRLLLGMGQRVCIVEDSGHLRDPLPVEITAPKNILASFTSDDASVSKPVAVSDTTEEKKKKKRKKSDDVNGIDDEIEPENIKASKLNKAKQSEKDESCRANAGSKFGVNFT